MNWLRELVRPDRETDFSPEGRFRLGQTKLERYDKAALGFLLVIALIWLSCHHKLLPDMSDMWYHLAVSKQVYDRAEIPEWADWEYGPWGRPHLYPPLLHVTMALLAIPFGGDLIPVSCLLSAVFLPLALFTAWYGARWILGAGGGLLALVLISMDLGHTIVVKAYIPSTICNILLPLLVVAFLSRRAWLSIALLTAMYYAHLGIPHLVALGLLLFGLKFRRYDRLTAKVLLVSFLLYTPWLARPLLYHEWLHHLAAQGGIPGNPLVKLLSLQFANLLIVPAGLWGFFKRRKGDLAHELPFWLLIGVLPLLASYGGRYMMHTMPLWAMFGAWALRRFTPAVPTRLRCAGFILFTLVPVPQIMMANRLAIWPAITASHFTLLLPFSGGALSDGFGEKLGPDCHEVSRWLERHTEPDELIHANERWAAPMITLLSGRPTDFGAWWEVGKPEAGLDSRRWQESLGGGIFVYISKDHEIETILEPMSTLPGMDDVVRVGRFAVGRRLPRRIASRSEPLDLTPETRTGLGLTLTDPADALTTDPELPETLVWRPCVGERGRLTLQIPVQPAEPAEGLGIWLKANRAFGGLRIGLRGAGDQLLETAVALPRADRWTHSIVVTDWLGLGERGDGLRGLPTAIELRVPSGEAVDGELEVRVARVEWLRLDVASRAPEDFVGSWRACE